MPETADSHLTRLANATTGELLAGIGFDWGPVDINASATLRFKRYVDDAPSIVGLLGGASSGKSTLFNSLLGREISRVSAHAHETLGPIAAASDAWVQRFQSWNDEQLIFPGLQCDRCTIDETGSGRIGSICVYPQAIAEPVELPNVVLMDLPDVTSKMSADEGLTTRTLLPWFDGLVVVVDEERWFDAATFDDVVELARNFGPRLWVVFNRSERVERLSAEDRQKLADHARERYAADSCVSPFQPGSGYRSASPETRQTITLWMENLDLRRRRIGELEDYLRCRCAEVVRENVKREEQSSELRRAVDGELASLRAETNLSADLLTNEERLLLGFGRRVLPLYDLVRNVRRRLVKLGGRVSGDREIDFEKRTDALAEVLRRNLEHRFRHTTDRIDRFVSESPYLTGGEHRWVPSWTLPEFDERAWAMRIRAHIDAWKAETARQSRRGDTMALAAGTPLLLADLLFLGGAGLTLTWATVWVAGFFGGKSLVTLVQRSPAFQEYQTTVRAYQSFIREALTEQWEANLTAMPRRHLSMTDPLFESVMCWSTPGER